jgi:hypothetical protein
VRVVGTEFLSNATTAAAGQLCQLNGHLKGHSERFTRVLGFCVAGLPKLIVDPFNSIGKNGPLYVRSCPSGSVITSISSYGGDVFDKILTLRCELKHSHSRRVLGYFPA